MSPGRGTTTGDLRVEVGGGGEGVRVGKYGVPKPERGQTCGKGSKVVIGVE